MDARALELRDQFFRLLDENAASPDLWRDVWRLFVEHPWYQEDLRHAVLRLLRRKSAPLRWAEDIAQDAMLLLGEHLRKSADLDVDRARAAHHFSGWLGRIIARDCQRALRSLRRREIRAGLKQRALEGAQAKAIKIDELIDLAAAIRKLPRRYRRIVALRVRGWRVTDIAATLHLTIGQARWAYRQGLLRLSQVL